jgi:hypothetical protein
MNITQRTQLKNMIDHAVYVAEQCFGIQCVFDLRQVFSREKWSPDRYVRNLVFQTNRAYFCNLIVKKFYKKCRISVHGLNEGDLARMQYHVEASHYHAVIIKKFFTNDTDIIAHKIAQAIIELLVTSHMFPELRETALQITSSIKNERQS